MVSRLHTLHGYILLGELLQFQMDHFPQIRFCNFDGGHIINHGHAAVDSPGGPFQRRTVRVAVSVMWEPLVHARSDLPPNNQFLLLTLQVVSISVQNVGKARLSKV